MIPARAAVLAAAVLLAGVLSPAPVRAASGDAPPTEWVRDLERVAAAAERSLVRVIRTDGTPGAARRLGTGISLGDGRVLTCAGVVGNVPEVLVASTDGDTLVARVLGVDRRSNLAVIEAPGLQLPVLPVSGDALVLPGTWVAAVGLGSAAAPRATFGSVVLDSGPGLGFSEVDMIQSTAPLFRGYTGGALLNRDGELVGIVSGVISTDGRDLIVAEGTDLFAGFLHRGTVRTLAPNATTVALPARRAVDVANQIVEAGFVERAYLGLQVELGTPGVGDPARSRRGVLVHQVVPGAPAERAGLLPGDFILEFGGVRVFSPDDLSFLVASRRPGAEVRLRYLRRGRSTIGTVILDQAPPLRWEPDWDEALAGREADTGPGVTRR